jgi:hypothetical protein
MSLGPLGILILFALSLPEVIFHQLRLLTGAPCLSDCVEQTSDATHNADNTNNEAHKHPRTLPEF